MANLAQYFRVPEDHYTIFRTGESNVETTWVIQETYPLVFITPDTTENNVVLLSSLEGVHARHFHFLVEVFLQRPIELHIIDDIRALTLVRSNDTDLRWNNTRLEELGDDLLNVGGFRPG